MIIPARVSVIGAAISICDSTAALRLIEERLLQRSGGYICFTNAHASVMCRRDPRFRKVTHDSFLSVADGKSVYWAGRLNGASSLGHVPGPDFMIQALSTLTHRKHFFYGSSPAVLDALVRRLQRRLPKLTVCGTLSPPFRELTPAEIEANYETIRNSGADLVWVGLGAPKQELWMAEAWKQLQPAVLLGVGAAFDFHAGTVRRAPALVRHLGFEWLYRLLQEPKRLWRRYLVTNSLFLYYSIQDAWRPMEDGNSST